MVHLRAVKGSKAYRLFNPNTGGIQNSKDVQFEEDKESDFGKTFKIQTNPNVAFTIERLHNTKNQVVEDILRHSSNKHHQPQITN